MTRRQENFDFDEIMDITEIGEIDTYDFVIPGTHCFIANGIVVHNSGDLEQNADNVWGLYRAETKSEYAQLIQLKGRDVGIWDTWLRFDGDIQKFRDCDEQYSDSNSRGL